MLLAWMAYATLVSAAAALAALAMERALAIWNVPRRFVWLTAMTIGTAVPVVLARTRAATAPPVVRSADGVHTGGVNRVEGARVRVPGGGAIHGARAARPAPATAIPGVPDVGTNRLTVWIWLGASSVLLLLLVGASALLAWRRRSWREVELDGQTALMTQDIGPAVIGVLRPRIVLPAWALALDAGERQLMLRHEREHVRAADPVATIFAALLIVAFPWNAALWWMMRRLRLAIEVDCDGRVIRAAGRPHDYGLLLLTVGARRSAFPILAASLVERQAFLERRLRAIAARRPARPVATSTLFGVGALLCVALGASAPRPTPLAAAVPTTARRPVMAGANMDRVRALLAEHHPSVLAGDTLNRVTFLVDADGRYLRSHALRATPGVTVSTQMDFRPFGVGPVDTNRVGSVWLSAHPAGVMGPAALEVVTIALRRD
jgi:bla regulator protein BlaR1